jgi:hypothetical protein
VRETHADWTVPKAGSLPKFLRDHQAEVAAFMRGFIKSDAPRARPTVEDWLRSPPLGPLPDDERRKRAIIDRLPAGQRRLICAAGHLLYTGFTLHRIGRKRGVADPKAHAKSVAKGIIREMRDLFGSPRLKSARTLTLMFTGEGLSMRAMRGLAATLPPVPEGGPLRYRNISKRTP